MIIPRGRPGVRRSTRRPPDTLALCRQPLLVALAISAERKTAPGAPGTPQPPQPGETRRDPLGSWARGLAPGSVSYVSGVVGLWPRNSRVDRSMFISDAEPHSPEDLSLIHISEPTRRP